MLFEGRILVAFQKVGDSRNGFNSSHEHLLRRRQRNVNAERLEARQSSVPTQIGSSKVVSFFSLLMKNKHKTGPLFQSYQQETHSHFLCIASFLWGKTLWEREGKNKQIKHSSTPNPTKTRATPWSPIRQLLPFAALPERQNRLGQTSPSCQTSAPASCRQCCARTRRHRQIQTVSKRGE